MVLRQETTRKNGRMNDRLASARTDSRLFHAVMSGALLLIVLLGFGRSLFLRPFMELPTLPAAVWIHGGILTAWYVGAFAQSSLVSAGRTDLHRLLGWWVAGIGAAVIVIGTTVTLAFVGRRAALGTEIEARIGSSRTSSGAISRRSWPSSCSSALPLRGASAPICTSG